MTDQPYPGSEYVVDAAEVDAHEEFPTGPVDGELIDPVTSDGVHGVDDLDSVIEGEAEDLDEVNELADSHRSDDADESGSNGTGVLVLDTWQIQIPATGDSTVDAALARLTDVEGLPPAQHADVYEAVHAGLHEALADLDRA